MLQQQQQQANQRLAELATQSNAQQQTLSDQLNLARDQVVNLENSLLGLQQVNQMMIDERREIMDACEDFPKRSRNCQIEVQKGKH